jgi:signal transduction histidine kinase
VIAAVAAAAIGGRPTPALSGSGLGVTLALCAFAVTLGVAVRGSFTERGVALQAATVAAMGAAGIGLAGLQPKGTTVLAGGAAVWMAIARLPLRLGVPLAVAVTVGIDVAAALRGSSPAAVAATSVLCALLGIVAYFMKEARRSQERAEFLLAQLEDAREEQLKAAAIAERGRIASELHDVLAHSLSGAAIQLQGARKLAERERTSAPVRDAIERASELVKEGLASARQAVGALRGDDVASVDRLEALVVSFREDLNVDATLTIQGDARPLPADASLALYRGAQEALTNVARYAPGAKAAVALRYEAARTTLVVEDRLTNEDAPATAALSGVGGGRGLQGMQERLERAGGSMRAGPTRAGWRVELEVPA